MIKKISNPKKLERINIRINQNDKKKLNDFISEYNEKQKENLNISTFIIYAIEQTIIKLTKKLD